MEFNRGEMHLGRDCDQINMNTTYSICYELSSVLKTWLSFFGGPWDQDHPSLLPSLLCFK